MHITILKILSTHIVKMIRCREFSCNFKQITPATGLDLREYFIISLAGIELQIIFQPGRKVSLRIGPGNRLGIGKRLGGIIHHLRHIGGPSKGKIRRIKNLFRKMPHKFKDAGLFPLVLTKGLIVHKKIDKEIPTALFDQGEFRQPINKLFCRQRKLRPGHVRETKGNIIGQTIILEKKKKTMVVGSIGIKRGSPFEDLFGPLGKDHLKTLLLLKAVRQLILINKLRVSKDDGAETKLIHHKLDRKS